MDHTGVADISDSVPATASPWIWIIMDWPDPLWQRLDARVSGSPRAATPASLHIHNGLCYLPRRRCLWSYPAALRCSGRCLRSHVLADEDGRPVPWHTLPRHHYIGSSDRDGRSPFLEVCLARYVWPDDLPRILPLMATEGQWAGRRYLGGAA